MDCEVPEAVNKKLLEITFRSPSEIAQRTLRKGLQMRKNLESAVAETVLFGVTRIAMDTPVDTGRARANIAGEFGDVDISGPTVDPGAVADGRKRSPTRLNLARLEGVIGCNVEYILPLEFGHVVKVKAVTGRVYAKRDASGKVRRVPGKAMFRKNFPAIRTMFRGRCQMAVRNGLRGEGMGGEA